MHQHRLNIWILFTQYHIDFSFFCLVSFILERVRACSGTFALLILQASPRPQVLSGFGRRKKAGCCQSRYHGAQRQISRLQSCCVSGCVQTSRWGQRTFLSRRLVRRSKTLSRTVFTVITAKTRPSISDCHHLPLLFSTLFLHLHPCCRLSAARLVAATTCGVQQALR